MRYNLLPFRFGVYNAVSISALNPDMYYQKRKSHKEKKRLPRFACTEVINISENILWKAYYGNSNFMHITLLLKCMEPISNDLLFPNWKHWVGSGKILKSFRMWLGVLFWWLKSSGWNAADGQNGVTNTLWAFDSLSWFMTFGISCIGGTKWLFSCCQDVEKASTQAVFGHQYFELKTLVLHFYYRWTYQLSTVPITYLST